MTKEELFLYAFRCAEAIYRKPGQPVKTKAEILAEMPENIGLNTTVIKLDVTPQARKLINRAIDDVLRLG